MHALRRHALRATRRNNNKWNNGDEYEVEGNALALLGIILDHLDELVEQVDQIAPGETDKEIPLIGISTKELVGKIQSVKQTLDDLRGLPLAEINCTHQRGRDEHRPRQRGRPFDLSIVPDNQPIYCRAARRSSPTRVIWTAKAIVGTDGDLVVGGRGRTRSARMAADDGMLDTVGPDRRPRASEITRQRQRRRPTPTTRIDEWRSRSSSRTRPASTRPSSRQASPPQSLQDLEKLIEEKLGVADPNVFKLDLLDLPDRGDAGPIDNGDHGDVRPQRTRHVSR